MTYKVNLLHKVKPFSYYFFAFFKKVIFQKLHLKEH